MEFLPILPQNLSAILQNGFVPDMVNDLTSLRAHFLDIIAHIKLIRISKYIYPKQRHELQANPRQSLEKYKELCLLNFALNCSHPHGQFYFFWQFRGRIVREKHPDVGCKVLICQEYTAPERGKGSPRDEQSVSYLPGRPCRSRRRTGARCRRW